MAGLLTNGARSFVVFPGKYRAISRLLSTESSDAKESKTIGFIGLGNMGRPMARNLLKNGHTLFVNDVVADAVKELESEGAAVGESPADIASKATTIITMLPSSPHVAEVYFGKNGIMEALAPIARNVRHLRSMFRQYISKLILSVDRRRISVDMTVTEGSLLIDSSTINPDVAKEVASRAEEKGATYLDAPVSGGVIASKNGTLSFLVGGSKSGFERAKPILECMGQNIFHCGGTATGQAVKICNNLLLGISMIGTSEAMNLGIKLGLDPKLLAEVINRSTGRCWSSELYNPCPGILENVPSTNNYQGGFGTALMVKDLGLAQDAATSTKTATPLGSLAHQIYRVMCNRGYGHLDFSSAFKFLKEDE